MKRMVLLNLLFLFVIPTTALDATISQAAQDEIPYIYYYSEALNGVVIERADGTDSRIIGQGLADEDVLFVHGPGWSPDGKWFAWRVATPSQYEGALGVGKGYVVSADGLTSLGMLARFPCVYSMLWHPTDNILFVYGTMATVNGCPQSASPVATYWLIDVETQTLLATFSIESTPGWRLTPLIYWFPDEKQVQFFESSPINAHYEERYFLVALSYDGTVTMEPVSQDEAYSGTEGIAPATRAFEDDDLSFFTRWSETIAGRTVTPPLNSSAVGSAVSGQWDSSGNWLLVGYEFCVSGCAYVTGRVNIFNPQTGHNREISDCGSHPTCVGWLPERINLADLPPGRPTSVLPTPQSMDYSHTFWDKGEGLYGWLPDVATHDLVCNRDVRPPALNLVRNRSTREVDFVIPNGGSCGEPVQFQPELVFPTEPIVFARSPDGQYYAITDSTEYTSLYDAETGERIATLNFYGIELSFSEDSRYLITTGRFATATWDIQELVTESVADKGGND